MGYQIALGCGVLVLIWLVIRAIRKQALQKAEFQQQLYDCAAAVLKNPRQPKNETLGVHTFEDEIDGTTVQLRFIADTLAVRKLPVLWLSISVLKPTNMTGRYDVMCRPASVMSFSNFHLLPHSLDHPLNEALHMQLRSDQPNMPKWVSDSIISFKPLEDAHAKELIIDKNGIRFVVHLSDADRARYGVMRQAAFVDPALSPFMIKGLIGDILKLHDHVKLSATKAQKTDILTQENEAPHAA